MVDCLIRVEDLYVLNNNLCWTLLCIVICMHKDLFIPQPSNASSPGLINGQTFWKQMDYQESVIDIKIVSATTLLVCFLSLKETACETSKYKFILLKRLFSFSRKSKFRIVEILSKKKKIILLNNLGSKNSLLMNLASLYHVTNKKKLSKNYIKAITWKLVSGLFVFPKN